MGRTTGFSCICRPYGFVIFLGFACIIMMVPMAEAWSKDGHVMTCQIAQANGLAGPFPVSSNNLSNKRAAEILPFAHLQPEAAEAVRNLLPDHVDGNLSALCIWPDQVRHWSRYRWTSPLHFIDTPDKACTYDYSRDCHDTHGTENMCVAGAIQNFTSQLLHYREGSSDRRYNLTEALLFLSHFMGDVHQPLHVGYTSDKGGNSIDLRWFRRKSNLHHVWDSDIIRTAAADYYNKDMGLLQEAIEGNVTNGIWMDDVSLWNECDDILSCSNKYADESIKLACKWGYKGVEAGSTLTDEYFNSRMPIVMKRIAQGGIRLSMILNRVFGAPEKVLQNNLKRAT